MKWPCFKLTFLSTGLFIALTACRKDGEVAQDGNSLPEVTLQTDWYAQPETGGFFHAMVEGYYREEGVEVDVRPSNPQLINLQMVATGEVDFGITRIEDLLMAAARGMPLQAVSVYLQKSPLALMLHESNPAQSMADLDGKTVMVQMGKPFHLWIEKHFEINLRAIPHDYGIQRFVTDKSERFIQQAYLTNEPYAVRKAGVAVKLLPFSDAGYQTFLCLYTTKTFAQDNPEVVRKVVRASARGWKDYLTGNASKTNELIHEFNPTLKPDHIDFSRSQIIHYKLSEGDYGWDGPFYEIDFARAEAQFELLVDLGMVPADFNWRGALTDAFYPQDLNTPAP